MAELAVLLLPTPEDQDSNAIIDNLIVHLTADNGA